MDDISTCVRAHYENEPVANEADALAQAVVRKRHYKVVTLKIQMPMKFTKQVTLTLIQLACLGKTDDVRQFGYDAFLYPFI